ncbi:MAG: hypothetical protein QNK31_13725 [Porticoccus sp.]|nr:hypothetical protein [Porticoccus sp.]
MSCSNHVDHFCLPVEPVEQRELQNYLKDDDMEVNKFQEKCGAQVIKCSIYIKDIASNTAESNLIA